MNDMTFHIDTAIDLMLEGRHGDALIELWVVRRHFTQPIALRPMNTYPLLAEARASVALDGDTYSLATELDQMSRDLARAKQGNLPKMRPIKQTKRVIAREVTCPTCGAKPGDPCLRMTTRGRNGKPVPGSDAPHFHHPRVAKAREARAKNKKADAIIEQAARAEVGE